MNEMSGKHKVLIDRYFAVARAISHQTGLHYRGQAIYNKTQLLPYLACHINSITPLGETTDDIALKGKLDSIALNIELSDPQIHKNYRPTNPADIFLFDFFLSFEALTLGLNLMRWRRKTNMKAICGPARAHLPSGVRRGRRAGRLDDLSRSALRRHEGSTHGARRDVEVQCVDIVEGGDDDIARVGERARGGYAHEARQRRRQCRRGPSPDRTGGETRGPRQSCAPTSQRGRRKSEGCRRCLRTGSSGRGRTHLSEPRSLDGGDASP